MSPEPEQTVGRRLPESWRPSCPVFAFHEDSNANAVLITPDGDLYAVAEERLTRKRFQAGFPKQALAWMENISGLKLQDAPVLIFGNRTHILPRLFGGRLPSFEHDLFGFTHKAMLLYQHLCYRSTLFSSFMAATNRTLLRLRFGQKVRLVDHHHAHAASAYYTSGWESACAVSVDNYGDGFSAKVFDCDGSEIRYLRGTSALASPGQFYGEIAQIAGIHPLQAGKLTGMAAYGDPTAAGPDRQPSFGVTAQGKDFTRTFSVWRSPGQPQFQKLKELATNDLAAMAQRQFEDALVEFVRVAVGQTQKSRVALSGGCFANVRVNQRVLELPEVESVWVHPAMSDQGIALGAALAYISSLKPALPFRMDNIFLGPEPNEKQMRQALEKFGLPFAQPEDLDGEVAALLADGKIVATFFGPMEYGLRALGNRSILYRTTDPDLQNKLNQKLQRAAYMPFAPVTMAPFAKQCYEGVDRAIEAARFMTISLNATDWMKKTSPGVIHVDGTVRPQILRSTDNPAMYRILERYHTLTNVPSLVNTSFNMHDEPIVGSPADACKAFCKANLDVLVMGPYLVRQKLDD